MKAVSQWKGVCQAMTAAKARAFRKKLSLKAHPGEGGDPIEFLSRSRERPFRRTTSGEGRCRVRRSSRGWAGKHGRPGW